MEIVPADPTQVIALRDLHVITWEVTFQNRASEAWYGRRLAEHRARDWGEIVRAQSARGGGVLTAQSDGQIVGLCQDGPTEDHDDDSGHVGQVERLYVHPARQRVGIGRSLLNASVDRVRRDGARSATYGCSRPPTAPAPSTNDSDGSPTGP